MIKMRWCEGESEREREREWVRENDVCVREREIERARAYVCKK